MNARSLTLGATLGLLGLGASAAALSAESIPYATPAGITLVDVDKILTSSSAQFIWRRLGDESGKPLYTYDQDPRGRSSCTGACAKEFTPFLAASSAKPSGDWTLIERAGARQWAYQGKALYRYAGQDPPNEPFGGDTATQVAENPDWYNPASKFYSPKSGWRRAAYTPEKSFKVPAGIALSSVAVANGFGLVDASSGMTLYAVAPSRTLSRDWKPMYASALALPVADFTILTRKEDGTHQWAYKGEALYTYAGDYASGEVNGIFEDKSVQAALVYRNYLPGQFAIGHYTGRGPLLTTRAGMTVYTEARYNLQYGGRETRTGYVIPYSVAKDVGTRGCVGSCTQRWKPVLAPAGAHSWGFWELATRPDGRTQWAYKGSPLYTYAGDKKPGDIEGNNRHVVVYGDPEGKTDLSVAIGTSPHRGGPSMESGAGFYWHTAGLFF